jgi:hypothetical protein
MSTLAKNDAFVLHFVELDSLSSNKYINPNLCWFNNSDNDEGTCMEVPDSDHCIILRQGILIASTQTISGTVCYLCTLCFYILLELFFTSWVSELKLQVEAGECTWLSVMGSSWKEMTLKRKADIAMTTEAERGNSGCDCGLSFQAQNKDTILCWWLLLCELFTIYKWYFGWPISCKVNEWKIQLLILNEHL